MSATLGKKQRRRAPSGRVSKLATNAGTDFALELLRKGYSDIEIVSKIERARRVSGEQAEACLDAAYKVLNKSHGLRSSDEKLALAVEQRNYLVRQALEGDKCDVSAALRAMDSRDKLLNLPADSEGETAAQNLLQIAKLAIEEDLAS